MKKIARRLLACLIAISLLLGTNGSITFAEQISTISEVTEETIESIEVSPATPSEMEDAGNATLNTQVEEPEEEVVATSSEPNDSVGASTASPQEDISTSSNIEKEEIATLSEIVELNTTVPQDMEEHGEGFIPSSFVAPLAKKTVAKKFFGDNPIPASMDMRNETTPGGNPLLPDVRDQGSEGLCWSFSTLGMMEINLRKKGIIDTEASAIASDLSEAVMGYYTMRGLRRATDTGSTGMDKPGLEGHDYTYNPSTSKSGNQTEATLMLSSGVGAVLENADTEYSKFDDIYNNSNIDDKYAFNSNNYSLNNVQYFNKSDRDLIKRAIMANGSAGVNYRSQIWNGNGTHDFEWPVDYGVTEYFYYSKNSAETNATHAVIIVGWDDTVPKQHFFTGANYSGATYKVTEGNGAWLVRNSWGTTPTYMNSGYFWLSYYDPSIDDTIYSLDAIEADTYKYNYHYDTTGVDASDYDDSDSVTGHRFANIYKVPSDADHILEAVRIAVHGADAEFDVEIYTKNTAMSNPQDGTLASSKTGCAYGVAGIYTIALDNKVLLPKGTYYSIVLKAKTAKSRLFIDCTLTESATISGVSTVVRQHVADVGTGQSFEYNGTVWSDVVTAGASLNYRIKGLVNDALHITFNSGGGTGLMDPQPVIPGVDATLHANAFNRVGYEFDGWDDGNGNHYGNEGTINVTAATTLTAQWRPITYTITYNYHGGAGSEVGFEKTYGQEKVGYVLVTPTKEDYNFGGWYVDSSYNTPYTLSMDAYNPGDTTHYIHAKWISTTPEVYHTISFNANGGQGTMDSVEVLSGSNYNVPANKFTKSGFSFKDWLSDDGKVYTVNSVIENVSYDIVLKAEWIEKGGRRDPSGGSTSSNNGGGGGGVLLSGLPTKKSFTLPVPMIQIPVNYNTSNATWTKDASGNWKLMTVGVNGLQTETRNSFACITSTSVDQTGKAQQVQDFYYFDENGNMYTGWLKDVNGRTYYFETKGSTIGQLKHGWTEIDGGYYYFGLDGNLLTNMVTPDGYHVGADGKWQK